MTAIIRNPSHVKVKQYLSTTLCAKEMGGKVTYEVVLDELDGEGRLADTSTANDDKLVFSHYCLL